MWASYSIIRLMVMVEQGVSCALWIMNQGHLRITRKCEVAEVRNGIKTCQHFLGSTNRRLPDYTERCRRVKAVRKLPPIEERLGIE